MMGEVKTGLEGAEVGGQGYLLQEVVEVEEAASEEEESPGEAGFVCLVLCRCWFLAGFEFGQCCWAALWLVNA